MGSDCGCLQPGGYCGGEEAQLASLRGGQRDTSGRMILEKLVYTKGLKSIGTADRTRVGLNDGPLQGHYSCSIANFWLKPFWSHGIMNSAATLPYEDRRRTWLSVHHLEVALNYPRYIAESCALPARSDSVMSRAT